MTILFQKDWEKYPNAIIDTDTKNESFLRLSLLYREMGIQNHTFILSLHNPLLKGVDPFDPNLTHEQMLMISVEAKRNFWYYIREVARAPSISGGGDASYVRGNRGNIALYWLFMNHITVILEQIRQTGKSFSTDQLMIWFMEIRCENTEINLITKDDTLRAKNLARLKSIELELPWYLRTRKRTDILNTEEFHVSRLNNRYRGHLPSKSPKQALLAGRGLTSGITQFDETAYIYNLEIIVPSALAAGGAAKDEARLKNEPYGTIFTTTAGKKDDKDGAFMYRFLSNAMVWSEKLYDTNNLDHLESVIKSNTPRGQIRVYCAFNHQQLGYTDEWLMRKIQEAEADGDLTGNIDRDFFGKWTSGSISSPLPVELSDAIRKSQINEFYNEMTIPYDYIMRWYIDSNTIASRMNSGFQTLGIDTSDAVGRDDIALHLRDVMTGETLAAGNINETNLIRFSKWLVEYIIKYPNMLVIIERKSSGVAILDLLILELLSKNIDPFKRLYNRVVSECDQFKDQFKEINRPMYSRDNAIYDKYRKYFGFATSGTGATSRSLLYSATLLSSTKNTGHLIRDKKLIDQLLGLEIKNGRVDHPDGEQDDLCIAYLLSYWVITQTRNLEFYGIDARRILQNNTTYQNKDPNSDPYFREEQQLLRTEIEKLVEDIKSERDPFISQRLENKLISLSQKLVLVEGEVFSVDQLIKQLQDEKKLSNSMNSYQRQNHAGGGFNSVRQMPVTGYHDRPFGR